MLRSDRDERASRSRVCVDESVSGDFDLVERVHNLGRCVEAPAVSVHVEHDPGSFVALGRFHRAPQERQERRRNFAVQWYHDYIAFVNRFAGSSRRSDAEETSDANADRPNLHVFN